MIMRNRRYTQAELNERFCQREIERKQREWEHRGWLRSNRQQEEDAEIGMKVAGWMIFGWAVFTVLLAIILGARP